MPPTDFGGRESAVVNTGQSDFHLNVISTVPVAANSEDSCEAVINHVISIGHRLGHRVHKQRHIAVVGDASIGRSIVETLDGARSRAVLLANHGVFTIGDDPRAAVKAAVMCEDAARVVHLARQLGDPVEISAETVDALFDRYQNVYGQRSEGADEQ